MIEHVHGRSEQQHTLIGLAGAPRDDFGEKRFPDAGIADDDDVGAMVDEVEIHQVKDAALHLKTAFVMVELEAIDRATRADTCRAETPLDSARAASVQFHIHERLQRGGQAEILFGRVSQNLIQIVAHRRQSQTGQFLM